MDDVWTPHVAARVMLELLPAIGRVLSTRIREIAGDDATLMQVRVLMSIHERPVSASDLAKRRKVSLQSTSVLVQSLVERGWLVRVPDPDDRRRSLLRVTPEGLARAEAIHGQMTDAMAELLDGLTPEELAGAAAFLPGLRCIVTERMAADMAPEN